MLPGRLTAQSVAPVVRRVAEAAGLRHALPFDGAVTAARFAGYVWRVLAPRAVGPT
jgi:hypothetical protein